MDASFLEKTWDSILSRDPKKISAAFCDLNRANQKVVVAHLQKMVSEDGWHPEQVQSARVALQVIREDE